LIFGNPGEHRRIQVHPHDGVLFHQLLDLLGREADPGVAGNGLPVSLAVQNVGIVIQTVGPIGLFESLLLHPGDGQQIAMRLGSGGPLRTSP
jgi:hypothetical protein